MAVLTRAPQRVGVVVMTAQMGCPICRLAGCADEEGGYVHVVIVHGAPPPWPYLGGPRIAGSSCASAI